MERMCASGGELRPRTVTARVTAAAGCADPLGFGSLDPIDVPAASLLPMHNLPEPAF